MFEALAIFLMALCAFAVSRNGDREARLCLGALALLLLVTVASTKLSAEVATRTVFAAAFTAFAVIAHVGMRSHRRHPFVLAALVLDILMLNLLVGVGYSPHRSAAGILTGVFEVLMLMTLAASCLRSHGRPLAV